METRRLEYFVTLVQERSFRRAAATLYISQPALSQQIRRLESEVGVELVSRNVSPFELTPAGRRLLAQSQRILDEVHELSHVAARSRDGLIGSVKLGVAPSLMFSDLPSRVRSFRQAFPEVGVTLHRLPTRPILDAVQERRLDVGVLFSQTEHASISWAKMYDDPFVLALPDSHRLISRSAVGFADLRGENFLMLTRRGVPDLHDAVITACRRAGFTPRCVETEFHIDGAGYVDQIGLVAAGFGIAVIPRAVATLNIPGITYLPLSMDAIEPLATSLAWASTSRNPALSHLVGYLKESFTNNPA